jgi:uncharacterized protein with NAD-binding domain and iron-sulfur cluster
MIPSVLFIIMTAAKPRKIAVLGGGLGSLSAVHALTDYEGWQNDHEITVYQMGWRLGGKASSGRNAQFGQRIEEHGLHVMMGFYENLFRMMRSVYAECAERNLMPGSPFTDWTVAFKPHDLTTQMEFIEGRGWIPWSIQYPRNDRMPGDPAEGMKNPSLLDYFQMGLAWVLERFDEAVEHSGPGEPVKDNLPEWMTGAIASLGLGDALARGFASLLHLAEAAFKAIGDDLEKVPLLHFKAVVAIFDKLLEEMRAKLNTQPDDTLRRLLIQIDIGAAMLRGAIEDDLFTKGFASIDDQDLSEWLKKHGCHNSFEGTVKTFYDGSFAYLDGDPKKPSFAAGTAMRGLCRILFTYGHAIFWLMQAGMGDTIVAPMYLLLKDRGVKFKLFHRVRNVAVAQGGGSVSAIELDIQATAKNGDYNPLFQTPDGLYCWPAAPDLDQLNDGESLKGHDLESAWCTSPTTPVRLECGTDFDQVLFGISIASIPFICPELLSASSRWRDMVANIKTIQTQAVQLWMNKSAAETGWNPWSDGRPAAGSEPAQATSYLDPFSVWGDMSHLLAKEFWPADTNPRQIAYLVNPMPAVSTPPVNDPNYPAQQQAAVLQNATTFLSTGVKPWFPNAAQADNPDALDWNVLVDPKNGTGLARLDSQFIHVNIDPSERYVLSVPKSAQYRMRAGDTDFTNLFVCGDWIYTYLNGGCAEATVMSGLFASVAICGKPDTILDAFGLPEPPSVFNPMASAAAE